MTRTPKPLTEDDRILWDIVARTARPLRPRKAALSPQEQTAPVVPAAPEKAQVPRKSSRPAMPSYTPPVSIPRAPTHLDRPTLDRLAAGRLHIDARVDLHGMTQDEAHALLYAFLSRARINGARYVLVITGKGSASGGDGVLKRSLPGWLATPLFRALVSSHHPAARGHGGAGALYVRIRRAQPT